MDLKEIMKRSAYPSGYDVYARHHRGASYEEIAQNKYGIVTEQNIRRLKFDEYSYENLEKGAHHRNIEKLLGI